MAMQGHMQKDLTVLGGQEEEPENYEQNYQDCSLPDDQPLMTTLRMDFEDRADDDDDVDEDLGSNQGLH